MFKSPLPDVAQERSRLAREWPSACRIVILSVVTTTAPVPALTGEEHGEEAIRSGSYPKSRQPSTAVTEAISPTEPAALNFDPALVRPSLAAAAAEGLDTIRAALLDAAAVNRKTFVTSVVSTAAGRAATRSRSQIPALEWPQIQLPLNEGLGRVPQADENPPKVPQSVSDLRRLSFSDVEALVAARFRDLIHEAGDDAEGMLERRVRALAPEERQRLRAALDINVCEVSAACGSWLAADAGVAPSAPCAPPSL